MKFEKHIPVEDSRKSIVDVIGNETELSRQLIKQVMSKGAVWLTRGNQTNRVRRAKKALKPLDEIHLYYDDAVLKQTPQDARLIADNQSYSLWHKPYGMLSQGSKWGDHCAIGRWIETRLEPQRPAYLVHRLDRAASGLILLAHNKTAAAALARQFEQRSVDKNYIAIVKGKFAEPLEITARIDDREALSQVTPLGLNDKQSLSMVKVKIETGRKHQIRKHLAAVGFPILGDRLYDNDCLPEDPDLCLVSSQIAFDCPLTNERLCFRLPDDLLPSLPS